MDYLYAAAKEINDKLRLIPAIDVNDPYLEQRLFEMKKFICLEKFLSTETLIIIKYCKNKKAISNTNKDTNREALINLHPQADRIPYGCITKN